jgi:hypothetical protein
MQGLLLQVVYLCTQIKKIMSKNPIPAMLGACLMALVVFSCTKTTKNSIEQDTITGKWRKTRIAIDSNGNGVIDNLELLSVTSYDSAHVFVFSGDGTGSITSMNTVVGDFKWSLENNNTYLKITFPAGATGTSGSRHIDTLAKYEMTLRDTTGGMIKWDLYTKQ